MPAIHETAYPRIKPNLNHKELQEIFAPSDQELALLNRKTKKTLPVTRLGFMILLKCYQYLGRPVMVKKIDPYIIKYIANKLNINPETELSGYDKSGRKRHIKIVRQYLQINSDKFLRRQTMKKVALESATNKENLADIINCIIDELIKGNFELPVYQKLVRLSSAARIVINNSNYSKIVSILSDEQKRLIDIIVGFEKSQEHDGEILSWVMLKLEPKKPTAYSIRNYLKHVNKLRSLREKLNINLEFITPARLEQLRDEAIVADLADMKEMRPLKRYALATILVYMKATAAADDMADVFSIWYRNIYAHAKNKLEEYRLKQAEQTDTYVLHLYQTLLALKNNKTADAKISAIEEHIGNKTDELIEQCEIYLGLTGENHIKWMLKPYNKKRYLIFQLLDNLEILSSSEDKSIENALRFIMHHRHSRKDWIELSDKKTIQPDLTILTSSWFKAVTGSDSKDVVAINRHYYEIAVYGVLVGDLNCGDAFVNGGFNYDNPSKQFITWEEFDQEVDNYCALTKLPKDKAVFIEEQKDKLHQAAKLVDEQYPNNKYLVIEKGIPALKKLPAKKDHPELAKLKSMVAAEMPYKSIVDMIIEVENWLKSRTPPQAAGYVVPRLKQ